MELILTMLVLAVLVMPVLLVVALVSISGLKRRVADLEAALGSLRGDVRDGIAGRPQAQAAVRAAVAEQVAVQPAPAFDPVEHALVEDPAHRAAADGIEVQAPHAAPAAEPSLDAPPPLPSSHAATRRPAASSRPVEPPRPSVLDTALAAVKRWFTVGNVPIKVGMLVMLAGVAALLKYASDAGWLRMPIELRLAGISAVALGGLVFGWRQRLHRPAFALALQGGAIGTLLLVVFAASKLYGLMSPAAAFALSIALVSGLGVLAVLQDSRTLAVLGLLAGFLAPIWLSTGSGSHVALFSYYAVLNAAIFGIAWVKSWRVLNLLGFVFTWGIGTLWGVLSYSPEKLASTQPFLILFFAFYLLIPVLYLRRREGGQRDPVEGSLVFGTPLVAFSLQSALLEGERMPLALCALALAALYAVLAWWLRRREHAEVLARSHALLSVGFATLAVPLALSAQATASVFALEGAALVWLGLRQQRLLPQASGVALQLAAAVAFMIGWVGVGPSRELLDVDDAARAGLGWMFANAWFTSALLLALAGFASAWAFRTYLRDREALGCYLWGLAWWALAGVHEIGVHLGRIDQPDALLVFVAFTGWLAAEVHRRRAASALGWTTLAALLLAVPLALWQGEVHLHPFGAQGAWAWLAYALLGVRSLVCLRGDGGRTGNLAQFAWWLVWPLVLSLCAHWIARRFALDEGWRLVLRVLPWLALAAVSLLRWHWLALPRGADFDRCRTPLRLVLFAVLGWWWLGSQFAAGGSAPLPWLPLLNPLELAQLATLALLAAWLSPSRAPWSPTRLRPLLLPMLGFVLVTFATLRAVHHWGGLPWNEGLLQASLAQTSLTVVWSLLGVVGWIVGSRRRLRALWLAGAILMGIVLAKLVLVDRQHLGDLLGIGSFIAYGLMCTLVGWFAPAPPREDAVAEAEVEENA